MTTATTASPALHFLEDRWDPSVAATLDEPELLRYRSNLLGSDLRITNFAGGNTSSKVIETRSTDRRAGGSAVGEGLGRRPGQHQAHRLCHALPGKAAGAGAQLQGRGTEDDMVAMYPLCAFRNNPVAASIDTPLHGFLPFHACGSSAPRLGDCAGGERQRQSARWRSSTASSATAGVAAVAAARL